MESEKANPKNHEVEEYDDDPPLLSSQAIEALRELLAEQNRTIDTDTGPTAFGGAEVALVTEDWRLSQFWYDRETAETVAREVHALCSSIHSPRVACLACPTLYVYLKVITLHTHTNNCICLCMCMYVEFWLLMLNYDFKAG